MTAMQKMNNTVVFSTWRRQRPHRYASSAVVILLVAFGIRVLDVATRSLWFDEAVEFLSASVPFRLLPEAVIAGNYQPPLNSYLLHLWIQISIEPIWVRLLAIFISLFTIVGLMGWAKTLFGSRGALTAGILIALMPTEVYYAQDVGEYALLVCTLTWALFFLHLAHESARWRYWILWALLSAASVYSHYGAIVVVVPTAGLTLLENVWRKRRSAVVRQLALIGVGTFVALPLVVYFLPAQIDRAPGGPVALRALSLMGEIERFARSIGDTFSYNLVGWPLSDIPQLLAVVALGAIGLLAIFSVGRTPKRLFAWFLAAFGFYFILVRTGFYVGSFGLRYGLVFTPLLIMAIVGVTESLWINGHKWLPLALLCLVVGVEVYALPNPTISQRVRGQPSWMPMEQMQNAFAHWQHHRGPQESTFVYYGAVPAFRYYLRVYGIDAGDEDVNLSPYVECSAQQATQVCVENRLFFSPWVRHLSLEDKAKNMEDVLGGMPERLWLIFSHIHGDEDVEILTRLEAQYRIEKSLREVNAAAYLLVRR